MSIDMSIDKRKTNSLKLIKICNVFYEAIETINFLTELRLGADRFWNELRSIDGSYAEVTGSEFNHTRDQYARLYTGKLINLFLESEHNLLYVKPIGSVKRDSHRNFNILKGLHDSAPNLIEQLFIRTCEELFDIDILLINASVAVEEDGDEYVNYVSKFVANTLFIEDEDTVKQIKEILGNAAKQVKEMLENAALIQARFSTCHWYIDALNKFSDFNNCPDTEVNLIREFAKQIIGKEN